MALSRTNHGVVKSAATATSVVSGSFTPANNSLVVVIAAGINNGGSANPAASFSISNTGGLTFTSRATAGVARDYGVGMTIWTAPVTTGASMTVTVNSVSPIQYTELQVLSFTGYNVASPVGGKLQATNGTADGAWNPTLDATPASTSEVVAGLIAVMNSGLGSVAEGIGWTELNEDGVTDWYVYQSQVRGSSTSTTVAWADTQANANSYYYGPTGVGLEIKADTGSSDTPLTVDQGTLTLTGQDVTLTAGNNLSITVENGALSLAGQDVSLIAGANVTLAVDNATLSASGQDVLFQLESPWTEGLLGLTGSEVTLTATGSITLSVDNASLTLTGGDVALNADFDYTIAVDNGALTLTGQDVTFSTTGNFVFPVENATLTLTGSDVGVNASFATSGGGAPRRKRHRGLCRLINCGR